MLSFFASEMVSATLRVEAAGSRTKGIWTPGSTSDTTINILAPQPLRPNEIEMLPSGEFAHNWSVTWLESAMGVEPERDRIVYGGNSYLIMSVSDRTPLGDYYRITMRQEKANE